MDAVSSDFGTNMLSLCIAKRLSMAIDIYGQK